MPTTIEEATAFAFSNGGGVNTAWTIPGGGGAAYVDIMPSQILRCGDFTFTLLNCKPHGVLAIEVTVERLGEEIMGNYPLGVDHRISPQSDSSGVDDKSDGEWNGSQTVVFGNVTDDLWGLPGYSGPLPEENGTGLSPALFTNPEDWLFELAVGGDGMATVYSVTMRIMYELIDEEPVNTGTADEDPLGPEGEHAYIPFSAYINSFLGISIPETGATRPVGSLWLAQFSNSSGKGLGIGSHYEAGVVDEFGNLTPVAGSNFTLVGRLSKLRLPFDSFTTSEIVWENHYTSSSELIYGGTTVTVDQLRRYSGFRHYGVQHSFGFFFPNCVVDDDDNIVHLANDVLGPSTQRQLNTCYDFRILARRSYYRVDGGSWTLGGTHNFFANTKTAQEKLNTAILRHSFNLDTPSTITWAILNNSGDELVFGGTPWTVVDPGWEYDGGEDKILNTSSVSVGPGESPLGAHPIYDGFMIPNYPIFFPSGTPDEGCTIPVGEWGLSIFGYSSQLVGSVDPIDPI